MYISVAIPQVHSVFSRKKVKKYQTYKKVAFSARGKTCNEHGNCIYTEFKRCNYLYMRLSSLKSSARLWLRIHMKRVSQQSTARLRKSSVFSL